MLAAVRAETPFELAVVEIDGDAALEAAHREQLPVVEVDGEQAFTWFVDPGRAPRAPAASRRADAAGDYVTGNVRRYERERRKDLSWRSA